MNFNINPTVYRIKPKKDMQNLINEISKEFESNILYIQSRDNYLLLSICTRISSDKVIENIVKFDSVITVTRYSNLPKHIFI